MSDGTPTLDSGTPEVSTTVETPAIEPNDPGLEAAPQPEPEPTEEFDEIEYDGEKYSVPKKLKNGFLMQQDYTKKTQTVAEERKAVEAEKAAIKAEREAAQAHIKDVGRVYQINDQIAEMEKLDWAKLEQENFFEAQAKFREYTLLKEKRAGLVAQIQDAEQKRSQEAQQGFAKRYAETNETLAKDIKGWNAETANKLRDFAIANGATEDDIRTLAVNAPLVKLLHKAWLGDELLKKQQTAAQTAEPKVQPKPLTKVTGQGAKPAVNLFDADMETYAAERRKQGFR